MYSAFPQVNAQSFPHAAQGIAKQKMPGASLVVKLCVDPVVKRYIFVAEKKSKIMERIIRALELDNAQ